MYVILKLGTNIHINSNKELVTRPRDINKPTVFNISIKHIWNGYFPLAKMIIHKVKKYDKATSEISDWKNK